MLDEIERRQHANDKETPTVLNMIRRVLCGDA